MTDLFDRYRGTVLPEWLDYNGHMNVAYYVLAFDQATDVVFEHLDIGKTYRQRANSSMFALEQHVTYDAELKGGELFRVTTQVLGADAKRLHFFHSMIREHDGRLAATTELMAIHVDLRARRTTAFPPDALARVTSLATLHADLPRPPQAGRVIRLKRR